MASGNLDWDGALACLRASAARGLEGASARETRASADARAFLEWLDDPRPEFASDVEGEDKFRELVALARDRADCLGFLLREVGVNASTVWRWANGRSRPSRYVGRRIASDLRRELAEDLAGRLAA